MKIFVTINGYKLCLRYVKRGDKHYWQQCPKTMYDPTPAQTEFRYNVAKIAHENTGKTIDEVGQIVKKKLTGKKMYHRRIKMVYPGINDYLILHEDEIVDKIVKATEPQLINSSDYIQALEDMKEFVKNYIENSKLYPV